jgi:hypothetical protein
MNDGEDEASKITKRTEISLKDHSADVDRALVESLSVYPTRNGTVNPLGQVIHLHAIRAGICKPETLLPPHRLPARDALGFACSICPGLAR